MLSAADLRFHIITIESKINDKDDDGNDIERWVVVHKDLPAAVKPLSVRHFVNAQAQQSKIRGRFVIRDCPGLEDGQRVIHRGKIYEIEGWLPDPDSGIEYVTAPYGQGVNLGGF